MLPIKFRQTLRNEVNHWRSEGLIDDHLLTNLANRYRFEKLEAESSSAFISALIGLGAILIGLGMLSFVAANWQYLNKPLRITILLSALLAVNSSGFSLWQRSPSAQAKLSGNQRLAQGLLLLGGLVLGANIALLAQLFHISGEIFVLFMGWSIGVLFMAYALGMTSLAVMAIALMGCGYWAAAVAGSALVTAPSWAQWLYSYMPLCSLVLFLPLVYRCRSVVVFWLTAIAWLSSFQFTATVYTFQGEGFVKPWEVIACCSLPPLIFWAFGRIQQNLIDADYGRKIALCSQRLAILSGALTCYLLSFQGFASSILRLKNDQIMIWHDWQSIIILFAPITIVLWIGMGKLTHRLLSTDVLVAGLALSIAGLLALAANSATVSNDFYWGFSLLLVVVTLMGIRSSLQEGNRSAFYFNWLLLATRILSWFAFIQVDLALKSVLFVLSGAVTIAVGIWFERRQKNIIRYSSITR
jgi:uncharacterized membrane protein